ncbi:MAG: ABC transporter substrate-binding protein [Candidatus Limnocylindrales bacterium]
MNTGMEDTMRGRSLGRNIAHEPNILARIKDRQRWPDASSHRSSIAAVLVVCSLIVASCAGAASSQSPSQAPANSSAPPPASSSPTVAVSASGPLVFQGSPLPTYSAPAGGLLSTIKQRGTLLNGMEATNAPWESVDPSGQIVGFDVDLGQKIAEHLGVKLDNIDTAFSGIIPSLYANKFDMILSSIVITAPRQQVVTFSQPYVSDQLTIYTKASDQSVNSVKDLQGKVLCSQLNSAVEAQAQAALQDANVTAKDFKSYPDFPSAFLDVNNGNCDAAAAGVFDGQLLMKQFPGRYRVAVLLPKFNYFAIAVRKPDTDLLNEVNAVIAQMRADGSLAALQQKWLGVVTPLP